MGVDPHNVVRTMSRIVRSAEDSGIEPKLQHVPRTKRGVVAYAAKDIATNLHAKAIITFTTSGDTARRVARLRPDLPLLAFTPNQQVRSQLAVTWGTDTFLCRRTHTTDDMIAVVDESLLALDDYNEGDTIVVVAGTPPGIPGTTNTIRVHELGEDTTSH